MDTAAFTAFVSFLSSNKQIKYMPVHSSELIKMLALASTSAVPQINVFVSRGRGSSVRSEDASK